MPKAVSSDMRWSVVWLHVFLKLSSAEVFDLFISKKSVERYLNKFITTGDVEPKTPKCGPYKKLSEEEVILVDLVLNNPGIFLHEL